MSATTPVSNDVDDFVASRMPAAGAMPEFRFDLPELQFGPQLNLVE